MSGEAVRSGPRAQEVCFLIGADDRILWRDQGLEHALPDSRARWEAIWAHRSELAEIAHTHPGGLLRFSAEDRSTMRAVWAGLDRDIAFSVVTPTAMIRIFRKGSARRVDPEPEWASVIRAASGFGAINKR